MFGLFKKSSPPATSASPPPLPSSPPPLPASGADAYGQFWDEMGVSRLVPVYLQLHLAARSPQNALTRRPDGSLDTDEVPALMIFNPDQPQIGASFIRLMGEQLAPAMLPGLTPEEIVTRLGNIYTTVSGKDMYAIVCKKWCVQRKLVS
ncbi:MAG TPA: hypothetical protein VG347_11420 [Verrucomicrobiae bacterium]|nr:hypothetical protein [Verrucomicrobiae bacterium]